MEIKNSFLPNVFLKFKQQVLHFVTIPIFLFLFLILYKPFSLDSLLSFPKGGFAFNSSIIMSIEAVVLLISRLLLWGLRNSTDFKRRTYLVWCFAEIVVASLFIAMYITLISAGQYNYIDVLPIVLVELSAILVFPYIILTMLLESDIVARYNLDEDEEIAKMRFYDEKHNLKFVADSKSILYIESHENYCGIHYVEGGRVKDFLLRGTMKSLEEDCAKHGIKRCHRSYFINVSHIRILRKDREGFNVAELDVDGVDSIPITPRYYSDIADSL